MITIDLRQYKDGVAEFVRTAIANFASENPDVEISTIGLSGTGFHGDVAIHFDTAANSQRFVQEFSEEALRNELGQLLDTDELGPFCGSDEFGKFCNNCEDFAFERTDEFTYPDYPNFYDVDEDEPVTVILLNGKSKKLDREEGDEAFNEVIFPFLKTILKEQEPFAGLMRAQPFRAGVQMNDSEFAEFWVVSAK